jgi:hypothetical protein
MLILADHRAVLTLRSRRRALLLVSEASGLLKPDRDDSEEARPVTD